MAPLFILETIYSQAGATFAKLNGGSVRKVGKRRGKSTPGPPLTECPAWDGNWKTLNSKTKELSKGCTKEGGPTDSLLKGNSNGQYWFNIMGTFPS